VRSHAIRCVPLGGGKFVVVGIRRIARRTGHFDFQQESQRKWELRHPAPSWAGVLSTSGGVVFSGDNEGDVFAADSRTGKELWRHQVGSPLYAAPSTYMIGARQGVIVPAGTTLTAFALPQR